MPCFPSLLLYVACCPPAAVVPSEEQLDAGGCPPEYIPLRSETCCGPAEHRAGFVLRQLEAEGLEDGGHSQEDRELVLGVLERLVRDFDFHSTAAWQTLAGVAARDAALRADNLKEALVQATRFQEGQGQAVAPLLPDLFKQAAALSRRLAKAALRLEGLQQFLTVKTAVEEFKEYFAVDLNDIRRSFEASLELYTWVIRQHDYLALQVLPQLQDVLSTTTEVNASGPRVNLLFASMGKYARTGLVTLWSMLKRRSVPLRVFVLGDEEGLRDWQEAIGELGADAGRGLLRGVTFEYVDYAAHPRFRDFRRRYPKGCQVTLIGWALLARALCHELLPADVQRVIALDIGDVLVLDDIRGLWHQFGLLQEHQMLAAAYVPALNHVSGGAVLYDLGKMRARNFTALMLTAAQDALVRSGDCIHDQSLLNTLHLHRVEHSYAGSSPIMLLPCRWMVVPATEWQPNWNVPEQWLPELSERRRYPGLVSAGRVEVYCPDTLDLLSAWAYLLVTRDAHRRLRLAAMSVDADAPGALTCAAAEERMAQAGADSPPCCQCGEPAALVHIPGDMKDWPSVSALLRLHSPPWKEWSAVDTASSSLTRAFWHRGERRKAERHYLAVNSPVLAETLGVEVCFDDEDGRKCCAVETREINSLGRHHTAFKTVNLEPSPPPVAVRVETTALWDARLLLGLGPRGAVELLLGLAGGTRSAVRWLPFEGPPALLAGRKGAPQEGLPTVSRGRQAFRFQVQLGDDGRLEVRFTTAEEQESSWGVYLPETFMAPLRAGPLRLYVGGPEEMPASWVLCKE